MERNKLENHIREVFKTREIEPSKEAWKSLKKHLNDEVPTRTPWLKYAGAAAG